MSLLDALIEADTANPLPAAGSPPTARREIFIAIRLDGAAGSGTPDDPYNGSTDDLLDTLLSDSVKVPPNSTILFGPGIFQTKGAGTNIAPLGWSLRNGMRITGSGIDQTTLQLVRVIPNPLSKSGAAAVMGGNFVSNIEISDLTLDANFSRLPKNAQVEPHLMEVACVKCVGNNIRYKRIRAINWGTHTPLRKNGIDQSPNSTECFPVYASTDYNQPNVSGENVAEDVIIEQPDQWPARESTLLNNHILANNTELYATTRNCVIRGEFTTGSPPPALEISRFSQDATHVTVKTRWPHRLQAGDRVLIENSSSSAVNGRHLVDSTVDFVTFKIALPNVTGNITGGTAQRYVPEASVVASLTYNTTLQRAVLQTYKPHKRYNGDIIRVSGALVAGTNPEIYNGAFEITVDGTDPTILYYNIGAGASSPGNPTGQIMIDRWPSLFVPIASVTAVAKVDGLWQVDYVFQGPHYKTTGDYVLIVGIQTTTGEVKNAWNGWFKVVSYDANQRKLRCRTNWDGATMPAITASTPLEYAQLETRFQGGSGQGQWGPISRSNRFETLILAGPYHDTGAVKDMITWDNYMYKVYTGIFEIAKYSNGDHNSQGYLTERNIVGLQMHPRGAWNHAHPSGVNITSETPLYHKNIFSRKNFINFADDGPDPGPHYEGGVLVYNCTQIISTNNIIDLPLSVIPVRHWQTTKNYAFNNTKPDGKLLPVLQGYLPSTPGVTHFEEIQMKADDLFWTKGITR